MWTKNGFRLKVGPTTIDPKACYKSQGCVPDFGHAARDSDIFFFPDMSLFGPKVGACPEIRGTPGACPEIRGAPPFGVSHEFSKKIFEVPQHHSLGTRAL